MQALLDECLPVVLRQHFPDHDVRTVKYMGWEGAENGELLKRMVDAGFDVFITTDHNLAFQQNLTAAGVGVIELHARTNRIEDLLPLVPPIRAALNRINPGELIIVGNEE